MGIEYLKDIEKDINRREISYDKSHNMVVSNEFILNSVSNLTLNEAKLLQLIITQCRKGDTELYTFSLKAKDFAKLLDVDPHDMRRNLRKMTRHIMQEVLEIENPKTGDWLQFHWTDECQYKSGIVTIKISDRLAPYLLDLQRDFTMIKLEELLPFKSRHATRIYQILVANMGIQNDKPYADNFSIVNVSMDLLRLVTNTKDKYPRFNNFNARVLAPAVDEINRVTNYHVTATPYRTGHAVSGIEFLIESSVGYNHRMKANQQEEEPADNQQEEQLDGQMKLADYMDTDGQIRIHR